MSDPSTAVGEQGLSLIKGFEKLKTTAYDDGVGVATIGYGHTGSVKKKDIGKKKITEEEAEKLLKNDLTDSVDAVKRLVKAPLNQNQFDALTSLVFNIGQGNFAKSTLLKKLNAEDYDGAAEQFKVWRKAGGKVLKGLEKRRAVEAALFKKGPTNV